MPDDLQEVLPVKWGHRQGRSSMAAAAITHSLPEDIVVDILARLPVKSLKRFRCVGKSWCCLIQSPQFITAHYSFSKNKTCLLMKQVNFSPRKAMVSFISNQTLDVVANLDIPSFTDDPIHINILGHCNGIICLCDRFSGILLWNIATKEFKILPMCPFECPPSSENTIDVAGLGYDSKRDEYKVIRIDTFWEGDFDRVPRGNRVALYNLTTDSWRKFNDNLTAEFFNCHGIDQVYSNGFYHCLAVVDSEELLLSFDMSNEVFVTTPFPDGRLGKNCRTTRYLTYLMEINGSLGMLLCHDYYVRYGCYDAWVLGEPGLKNSWTKLFTIESFPPATIPLGVGSDGEIFLVNEDSKFLAWHHRDNKEIKTLQFEGIALELAMYAESLVSFRGGTAFNH
ncbi:F-box/kelch-repeat protein At3g23880-like isoform X1 [Durio zibethinus]|uniref:F-box/kelch-repeat protein At3g23880-like isoform X1 n=1 Tax=Durio zibethinus TaxID=66656 RepID=A0A6P5YK15_DURZI|nr:F-box/kelch-repeat protein At3g23880-like isoform X1 [Durio zibethinus]